MVGRGAAAPPPPALALPTDCLARVFSFLDLRDRVRVSEVCRRFRTTSEGAGPLLWSDVAYTSRLPRLPALVNWLAARRTARSSGAQMPRALAMTVSHHSERWEAVTDAVRLCGPSLQALDLTWPARVETGDWLAYVDRLTSLSLLAPSLRLEECLGALPALRSLSVDAWEGRLELSGPGCLPPSLTYLYIVGCGLQEVPEALTRLAGLRSAYLSRNPLAPESLTRLAGLQELRLLSLIECFPRVPPLQLSTLTQVAALYLDYSFWEFEEPQDGPALSAAIGPLVGLQALGLSHTALELWPPVLAGFTALRVLYLERTGLAAVPASAAPLLRQLRILSLDFFPLLTSAHLLREATRLQTLYLGGLRAVASHAEVDATLCVLRGLAAPLGALERLVVVVHTPGPAERPSVPVFQFMLAAGRALGPGVEVEALDSEEFYGVSLDALAAL